MGSRLRLSVFGDPEPSRDSVDEAWRLVSGDIEASEAAMSRFREEAELVALDRHAGSGRTYAVTRRLRAALVAADRAGRVTGGMFDARVLRDLERLGYRGVDTSPRAMLDAEEGPAAPDPGSRWLALDRVTRTVGLTAPVDLGGIGKGLALRWAARTFIDAQGRLPHTWRGAMLDAGGDLVLAGRPPEGDRWSITIESPFDTAAYAAWILPEQGAVCTSSIAIHNWRLDDGRAAHHLIDPRTGEPGGEGILSVTVAWPDPAWAEVWSKTLLLAGPREIGPLARRHNLQAWWIDESGTVSMTPPARQATYWAMENGADRRTLV